MEKQGPAETPPILPLTLKVLIYLCFIDFQSSYCTCSKFRKQLVLHKLYFDMGSHTFSYIYYVIPLPKKYIKFS